MPWNTLLLVPADFEMCSLEAAALIRRPGVLKARNLFRVPRTFLPAVLRDVARDGALLPEARRMRSSCQTRWTLTRGAGTVVAFQSACGDLWVMPWIKTV